MYILKPAIVDSNLIGLLVKVLLEHFLGFGWEKTILLCGRNNRDRFYFGLFSFGCDVNISPVIVSKVLSGDWQSA